MVGVTVGIYRANTRLIEAPFRNQLAEKEQIIDNLRDSLILSELDRELYLEQKQELQIVNDSLLSSFKKLDSKRKTIKGTIKNLPNDTIISIANREYGGDTTGIKLSVPKNTVAYLVETSQEYKLAVKQLDLAIELNKNYRKQLDVDSVMFETYKSDLRIYRGITEVKDQEIDLLIKNHEKYLKKQKLNTLKHIGLGILIGAGTYAIIK